MLETQDRFGKKVTALLPIQVLDPDAKKFPIKIPSFTGGPKWTLEPGEEFMALWGTGYEKGRAFIEIEHRRKVIQAFWTELGATQQAVKQAVTEAMRGGFTVRITHVQENRAYLTQRQVNVPWSNKNLSLSWERFVSKLQPGQKETWTAVITGPDAKRAVAEMVAALYDQSLDAYLPHGWMGGFGVFRHDYSNLSSRFENVWKPLGHWYGGWPIDYKDTTMTYREFSPEIVANLWGYMFFGRGKGLGGVGRPGMMMEAAPAAAAPPGAPMMDGAPANRRMLAQNAVAERELGDRAAAGEDKQAGHLRKAAEPGEPQGTGGPGAAPGAGPDLAQVSARKNLNETAFFFPHLVSDQEGRVRIEFTMPEALTQWKFLGFAHDQQLRAGLLQDSAVTAKDLMVQPNPPRFLREGDVLEFTVKVTNQSATVQKGVVRLTLADARTEKSVDAQMGNTTTDQPFEIPAKESRSFSWRLSVPDGQGPIIYKAVGSTGRLSDGEEAMLPVLSRRVLVTESLPLPIRGAQTKKFQFKKLLESGRSDTLRSETLTVQMVSNPAWYAVMALPYLMEFPYECSEQVFNRLYANALARHIANSDPKIQRIFD
ncbi:MAG TPA: alpha-2-macroglobulin family protein, partial [Thermoguttaceae bacterium]|nr:alpha-2-macroglobulin family protein [Thermoguttaceae bacterium]